jgi:hypothetical protein
LANLTNSQESLERIVETKIHDLDVKLTEVQTIVEKLKDDIDAAARAREDAEDSGDDRPTTNRFQTVPRAASSVVVPVADTRNTTSAPAAAPLVPLPVSTPPASRRHQKLLQMHFSPCRRRTPELPARDLHLQELPRIVPRVMHSSIPIRAFWYLLPKGENFLPKGENLYRSLGFKR